MPPRARKTTDPTPAADEESVSAIADTPDEETPARPARKTAAAKQPAPEPVPDHWKQIAGEPLHTFCQICFPAGPQPGAGTIGCPHGTWVLVRGNS